MQSHLTIIILSICIVILMLIIFYQGQQLKQTKIQEKELDEYTSEIESIYRQMRGIRHDYLNHMHSMKALLDSQDTLALNSYISELINEQNQVDTIIRTGNPLIDALVNTKLSKAQAANVTITATAIAPQKLAISNMDLSIIIGNLLNNALEATTNTKTHDNARDNFIRVYIAPMKNTFYINVTNSMTVNPKANFLSLKGNNRIGHGIYRIDKTVQKYKGIINRQWEDGIFSTEVTLPL